MALLGPAPAVAIGVLSTVVESRVNRVRRGATRCNNLVIFALLGLVGGLLFDVARHVVRHRPPRHGVRAARAARSTCCWSSLNLALVASWRIRGSGRRPAADLPRVRPAGAPAGARERPARRRRRARVGAGGPRGGRRAARRARDHDPARAHGRRRAQERRRPAGAPAGVGRASRGGRAAGVRSRRGSCPRCCTPSGASARASRSRSTTARCSGWWRCGRTWPRPATSTSISSTRRSPRPARSSPRSIRRRSASSGSRRRSVPPSRRSRPRDASRSQSAAPSTTARSSTPCCCPVAQELVVNAVKHASPTAIDVQVTHRRRDDRRSRSTTTASASTRRRRAAAVQAGHVGLAMVRRRVEDAGGLLEIATRSDGGTRSRVVVPMR